MRGKMKKRQGPPRGERSPRSLQIFYPPRGIGDDNTTTVKYRQARPAAGWSAAPDRAAEGALFAADRSAPLETRPTLALLALGRQNIFHPERRATDATFDDVPPPSRPRSCYPDASCSWPTARTARRRRTASTAGHQISPAIRASRQRDAPRDELRGWIV